MIRVALADDHPFVLRGLRETLADALDVDVVGEAADGDAALALVRALGDGLDVLVTDLSMPGLDGLELIGRLRSERPALGVLVLTSHASRDLGVPALQTGAQGFVEKSDAPEVLVEAIRRVASGRRFVGPDLADALADEVVGRPTALSVREVQVVRALAEGLSQREAAAALGLSPSTVSTYRGRVLRKLGLRTDAELGQYAVTHGLVASPGRV